MLLILFITNDKINFPFRNLEITELTEVIEKIQDKEDLDEQGNRILNLLAAGGTEILERNHEVFLEIIEKADKLIESTLYCEIIQVQ